MSNLPNSKDTFTRVNEKTLQENIHRQLHNSLAETLENVQKYSGTVHVSALPSSSEVGAVYTLIQVDGEHQPGIYICTDDAPVYMPLASRGEGYVKQYEVEGETTVAIEHNLNSIGIFINAYDSGMNQVEYDELRIVDENNIELKFSTEFTGTLVLLAGGKDGLSPEHEWDGPKLRFKNPNGSWGEWMDLSNVAPGGPMGPMPAHEWSGFSIRFQQPGGSWGEWVNLRGAQGAPGAPGVGEPGPEGPKGPGVIWKGLFSLLNTYQKDDLVKYGRNVYICLVNDTTNILPTVTNNWEMYCEGGQNGSGAGSNIIEMEAGEDISCSVDLPQTLSSGEADLKVGAPLSYSKSYSKEVLGFKFNIKKIGNPIGTYTFKVFGETDGVKDTEPMAEWTYDASTIASAYELETYLFGILTDLQGVKYFDFSSEAGNASNYLVIKVDEYIDVVSSPYPVYVGTDGKIYVSQIAALREKCDGLVKTPVISGETATVTVFGIQDGFQELEVGKDYYLSETLGQITTDISNVKVGKAINYQEILMQDAGLMIRDKDLILQTEQGLGLNAMDPDNPVAQSPAQLIGGTNIASIEDFNTLGMASNGKFKLSLDDVEYDDVSPDIFATGGAESLAINLPFNTHATIGVREGQFKWTGGALTKFIFEVGSYIGSWTSDGADRIKVEIFTGSSPSSGVLLGEGIRVGWAGSSKIYEVIFNEPIILLADTIYSFRFSVLNSDGAPANAQIGTSNAITINTISYPSGHLRFGLYSAVNNITSYSQVANALQTAIRSLTNSLETVVYNTDHFEITSTVLGKNNGSSVLKLTAPSTGTDISGAGYLDLGANATEIAGDGDDYKLVRLDEDGQVPLDKLDYVSPIYSYETGSGSSSDSGTPISISKAIPTGTKMIIVSWSMRWGDETQSDCSTPLIPGVFTSFTANVRSNRSVVAEISGSNVICRTSTGGGATVMTLTAHFVFIK